MARLSIAERPPVINPDCASRLLSAGLESQKRASKTSHWFSSADIVPTILDAAGIVIPRSFHGESLRPTLNSKSVPEHWRKETKDPLLDEEGIERFLKKGTTAIQKRANK